MAWIKRNKKFTSVQDVFLNNIGVNSLDDVNNWFRKSYANEYRIEGIETAVSLINHYKDKQITICGDYDADGITATTILLLALKWAGYKNVAYRIPRRVKEGFGVNKQMIDEIDSGLVITVDNGIAQSEIIDYAKSKGLAVIVTDHHMPQVDADGKIIIPDADIVIDPNAVEGQADFTGYCGAGIAYKLACELLKRLDSNYQKGICQSLMTFAAIGTVADVMELREENYVLVRNGLKYMLNPSLCSQGLYALVSALGLTKCLTAHDVGFKIGPCINAASRMSDDGPEDVIALFTYNGNFPEAVRLAERLIAVNEARKTAKKIIHQRANKVIEDECLYGDVPMVVYIPLVLEGIIGITAGNLSEEFNIPVIVFTDAGDGILKGSGRACGNYNMKRELDKVSDLLERYGGHEGAAGLSIKKENLELLRERLKENCTSFETEDKVNNTYYDLEISAKDIPKVIDELSKYAPFGEGNAAPVFKVTDFSVIPRYGAYIKWNDEKTMAKLYSSNTTVVCFDSDKLIGIHEPKKIELIGNLSDNYFNGTVEHQIEISDIKSFEVKKVETPLAAQLKQMAAVR